MRTPLTARFDLAVPVVDAPMAGAAGGRLAAAISASGALGMVGASGWATPAWIAEQGRIAAASGRAWGVGLLAWALEANPDQLDAVADLAPPLVSVSYGPYERHLALLNSTPASRRPVAPLTGIGVAGGNTTTATAQGSSADPATTRRDVRYPRESRTARPLPGTTPHRPRRHQGAP